MAKKEVYGPIGKGGNGLIIHGALAIEPERGQSIGLLWQKLWNREPKQKPPKDETSTQKKKRQATARKEVRNCPFEQKECYRWVEALTTVEDSDRLWSKLEAQPKLVLNRKSNYPRLTSVLPVKPRWLYDFVL